MNSKRKMYVVALCCILMFSALCACSQSSAGIDNHMSAEDYRVRGGKSALDSLNGEPVYEMSITEFLADGSIVIIGTVVDEIDVEMGQKTDVITIEKQLKGEDVGNEIYLFSHEGRTQKNERYLMVIVPFESGYTPYKTYTAVKWTSDFVPLPKDDTKNWSLQHPLLSQYESEGQLFNEIATQKAATLSKDAQAYIDMKGPAPQGTPLDKVIEYSDYVLHVTVDSTTPSSRFVNHGQLTIHDVLKGKLPDSEFFQLPSNLIANEEYLLLMTANSDGGPAGMASYEYAALTRGDPEWNEVFDYFGKISPAEEKNRDGMVRQHGRWIPVNADSIEALVNESECIWLATVERSEESSLDPETASLIFNVDEFIKGTPAMWTYMSMSISKDQAAASAAPGEKVYIFTWNQAHEYFPAVAHDFCILESQPEFKEIQELIK